MSQTPLPVSDQPVLRLLNVESAYGPIKAIRGVSLKVRRGEIVTVLGSNGAGKSTILKTISGIIDPNRGSISYKGENITAMDPSLIVRKGISHVPEGREVFPLLSVRDNLLMGAYTRHDREAVHHLFRVASSLDSLVLGEPPRRPARGPRRDGARTRDERRRCAAADDRRRSGAPPPRCSPCTWPWATRPCRSRRPSSSRPRCRRCTNCVM